MVEGAQARDVILAVRALSKSFPGQVALDDVHLEVAAGEIHALVGQNGSGKSTLVKILAGYHGPDAGAHAEVDGRAFELGSAEAAQTAGLRFVHQDLALVGMLSVADNLCIVPGERRLLRRVDRRAERARAKQALASLGYDIDTGAGVDALAESERTSVALARALDGWADAHRGLLVLDEVTASLPGPEVARLFSALRRIRDQGVAILFVSHHLDEVLELCDRVTVLRDGRWMATEPTRSLTHESLVELILGRQLAAEEPIATAAAPGEAPVLQVRDLYGQVVDGIDLDIPAGQIVGIAGITGSGREEVAGLLAGRLGRNGHVVVAGRELVGGDPRAAIDAGVCCVPADRAIHALLGEGTVRENLTLADVAAFCQMRTLSHPRERRETSTWIDKLSITPPRTEAPVTSLSGGNQQKVVMARWLRMTPRVLVLDEPTQGVDVGSKADIHALLDQAALDGAAVIVCSTDAEELARLCSEVLVFQRGRIAGRLRGTEITVDRIEELQLQATAREDAP